MLDSPRHYEEPSHAERARTVLYLGRTGTLSTLSRRKPGWPFGSLAPYAPDEAGRPIFLLSAMAAHSRNLEADPRASLLVTQPGIGMDPLAAARVTLMGAVSTVGQEIREFYLHRYENARSWADFADFRFYRMEVAEIYFIGGFGSMGWISAEEYAQARPDPLADAAEGMLERLNSENRDELLQLARVWGGPQVTAAKAISIDRLGFSLRIERGSQVTGARMTFPGEAGSVEEARRVLSEMIQQRERESVNEFKQTAESLA